MTIEDKILVLDRILDAYGIPKKRGWQAALAKKLGINPNIVSAWKTRGVPGEKISDAVIDTGVNKNWILTGEGEMRPTVAVDPINGMISEKLAGYQTDGELKDVDQQTILHMMQYLADKHPKKFEALYDNIKATFIAVHK